MSETGDHAGTPAGQGRPEPTVHQLRLLLVIAQELHFGRAAARLFMSQPALSRQLRALEQRLGFTLFERSSRTVEATPGCLALLPEAEAVVRAMDQLRKSTDEQDRGISGRLVVGAIGAEASMPYARAILAELHRRCPRLAIEIRNLNFVDHMVRLIDGEVDAAFLRPPVPPGIQLLHMAEETRVVALPADDPLATRASLTLPELAGRPVVDVPPEVPRLWWDFWVTDPRPDGSPVRYGPVATDLESLLHTVAAGTAVAFLPAAARVFFPRPGVAYVTVDDAAPCFSALAWSAAARTRPTVTAVRQAAAAVLAGHAGSLAAR
ncbi:LysR family transcriptional regulator [Streptomyces sp. NRRL F-5123]|uniref:LysR family transcriptional regulator n=1 Tax=Streptomyces sp. NRRL F-5123 TaxID=1463856 RepID=UPI00069462DA|nr:LysR substrate-binding domain-containing protein [Streptomyces sp. NRRL F-5123]